MSLNLPSRLRFPPPIREPELLASIVREFPPAAQGTHPRVFVDVGGNVGFFSLSVASRGHRVVTFEPFPRNLRLLRQSTQLLHRKMGPTLFVNGKSTPRLSVFPVALSDHTGRMCIFQQGGHNLGNGRLMPVFTETKTFGWDSADRSCEGIVETARADMFLAAHLSGLPRIWGLKLDVEGHEALVLRGFQDIMKKPNLRPCHVWFEFAAEWVLQSGASKTEIFEVLDSLGYLLFKETMGDSNVEAHLLDPQCAYAPRPGLAPWTAFKQDNISWVPTQKKWTGI